MWEIDYYLVIGDFVIFDFLEIYVLDLDLFVGGCDVYEGVGVCGFLLFEGSGLFVYVKLGFVDIGFVGECGLEWVLLVVLKFFEFGFGVVVLVVYLVEVIGKELVDIVNLMVV